MSVTVIIPTFNRAHLIPQTIASLQQQTYPDWQAFIVDDGSTDTTPDLIPSLCAADPRLHYVPQPNAGRPSIARNHGARLASTPLLAFLDDDDLWFPEKLAKQVSIFEQQPDIHLCFTLMQRFGARADIWPDPHTTSPRPSLHTLLQGNCIPCSSVMMRRDTFRAVGGFDEVPALRVCEDYDLWLRTLHQFPNSLLLLPEILLHYREHPQGISRDQSKEITGLSFIYERAQRDWAVPPSSLKTPLKNLLKRRAALSSHIWHRLRYTIRAWLL
jgi:glycosyltransferase involved in cell wall biosynthesis